MHDPVATLIIALLALILVTLLWISIQLIRIAHRLEGGGSRSTTPPPSDAAPAEPASSPSTSSHQSAQGKTSDFDLFLAEDPSRQSLAKKEQSAAYRDWRKARGLTWNSKE